MEAKTVSSIKSCSVSAIIIRADGTREDLGTIAEWHSGILAKIAAWIRRRL
jgi:hypothetical protein